ncbi:MAG TPA: mechanosensitive ion channel family protein [Gemmatimonadaceae bacterium]|nr:mechanosensitive ion channel family protein [Gemmatimonadaceae bacterium]
MPLLGALAHPMAAQIPGLGSSQSAAAPRQEQVEDPLGRSTPRGTITALTEAVHRGDFVVAAQTMQLGAAQSARAEELARGLSALMDRYFAQPISSIDGSAVGALDDGLPVDRERVGPLLMDGRRVPVELVRVQDSQAGPIWLISSETLAQVPALYRSIRAAWFERVLPAPLVRNSVFGVSLAQWVLLAATFAIPLAVLWLLSGTIMALARRAIADPGLERRVESWYAGVRWPVILAVTLVSHLSSMPALGLPLTFRISYGRMGQVVTVIVLAWLLRRLLTLSLARARGAMWGPEYTGTRSLMLLGERLLKALVIVVAILAILTIVGVNTKTALAGLGIGGVALALGAQRTVENLLGGVFMLSDRALAVGDMCRIANRIGWVEDITLRSVRLRTLDRSLVSVPAGVLAQAGIENFATREKILVRTTLRLRHGTSVEQLRRILGDIRTLLEANPSIEAGTSRIRLIDFGEHAVELELFAYVLTPDFVEHLAVRESLLLEIAAIVEAEGSGFAQPTQLIVVDDTPGADAPAGTLDAHDPAARREARPARPTTNPLADSRAIAARPDESSPITPARSGAGGGTPRAR